MPVYEYRCEGCTHEWEAEQRITAAPQKSCPKCAADRAVRLIPQRTGFALVGGGWARDRYASTRPR